MRLTINERFVYREVLRLSQSVTNVDALSECLNLLLNSVPKRSAKRVCGKVYADFGVDLIGDKAAKARKQSFRALVKRRNGIVRRINALRAKAIALENSLHRTTDTRTWVRTMDRLANAKNRINELRGSLYEIGRALETFEDLVDEAA